MSLHRRLGLFPATELPSRTQHLGQSLPTYDTRNRLTNLAVNNSAAPVESYAYTLDAAGHRLSVSELSGRTVNYGYDSLYRLTNETIASDPHGINGAVNYTYDPVGNRKQLASTLAPVPAGLWNYDANDRFTAGDTYDNNGNTVSSGGVAAVYDFENHLVQKAGVNIVYDGDGNRVSKTSAGVTTTYLVDTLNPTGYAQVVYESFTGGTAGNREQNHSYVYGLELIGQVRTYQASFNNITQRIYYVYDGHGSVRALTDPTGAVTDTYDYDAFGNMIHSSTTLSTPTLNNYLFAGEQFDPDLNLYYNRARYLNVSTGRFWTMDTDEGQDEAPLSLHKYIYSEANPVDNVDPSGNEIDEIAAGSVSETLDAIPSMALVGTEALKLARFAALVQNYPGHGAFPTDPNAPNSIWSTIGGHVQMNAWTKDSKGNRVPSNSCAVRMSYDLNRSGFTIARAGGMERSRVQTAANTS